MTNYVSSYELQKQAKEQVKDIVKRMNGMSEREFLEKYATDVMFHKGFEVFVDLFMQVKFE